VRWGHPGKGDSENNLRKTLKGRRRGNKGGESQLRKDSPGTFTDSSPGKKTKVGETTRAGQRQHGTERVKGGELAEMYLNTFLGKH